MQETDKSRYRGLIGFANDEEQLALPIEGMADDAQRDIHLALSGVSSLQIAGYLVTERGEIDDVVAFCPVVANGAESIREAMARQLRIVREVARGRFNDGQCDMDILWLKHSSGPMPIPIWLYGLSCIPLKGQWDGEFRHPCPFSPVVQKRMARVRSPGA